MGLYLYTAPQRVDKPIGTLADFDKRKGYFTKMNADSTKVRQGSFW